MKTKLKTWAALGLGTAFLGTTLTACGGIEHGEAGEEGEQPLSVEAPGGEYGEGEGGEGEGGEGEGGESGHAVASLPIHQRVAFMGGHVKAGLALYKAGEAEMAAPHLLHPVSETHASETAGLESLGFDASLYEAVSSALAAGKSATEIEPQLAAAEANLAAVTKAAGGDPADIIGYLMSTLVEEYTIALTAGKISDIGEYQDAYGFAIVAREQAALLSPANPALITELDALIGLWPAAAPIPNNSPAPLGQVLAQCSKIQLILGAQ